MVTSHTKSLADSAADFSIRAHQCGIDSISKSSPFPRQLAGGGWVLPVLDVFTTSSSSPKTPKSTPLTKQYYVLNC